MSLEIPRWVSEKFIVEGLRDLELFGEQPPGDTRRKTNEASSESIASFSKQEIMSSFLPEGGCYELLTVIGKGFEDLMTVNLARYKPTGEYVTVRRINLEACSNEMVTFLQGELHVSKLFSHPNILPYRATFIADNELWVVTSFMAYGSAKDLICTHFMDGMNELAIAYILQGVLKALDYIHHMGYVHRCFPGPHTLHKTFLFRLASLSCGCPASGQHSFGKVRLRPLLSLLPANPLYIGNALVCPPQMLLEKLNGTVPCLLDTSTIPAEELTMGAPRSAANPGLSESLATSTPRTSNGDSPSHPYHRTFSPHFHHFVEQCLQRSPDVRPSASTLLNHSFFKQIKRRASEALPELLRPVTPITNFEGSQSQDPSGIFGLVTNLEELEVDDWEF
uniref:STE20-related kinase adapter protein alpha n=1 Tax=Sus scrofa TaxID=9823 RepID=A0A8D1XAI9_PIG